MKFTDLIVSKFGSDKIMHFLGGAWITSLLSPFGWIGVLIGFIAAMVLSFIKEKYLDSIFEFKDIMAAMFGGILSVLIYLVILFII